MNLIQNTEAEQLKRDLEVLKSELAILVSDYELLVNFACKNIQDTYMTLVGNHKLELLNLECEARKLKRTIEMIQSCINLGHPVVIEIIEEVLNKELQEWYENIHKYFLELKRAELNVANLKNETDDKEVKRIFRKLSKLLHPDINPDLPEKFKLIWNRVYKAYKECDLEELRTLELMIEIENVDIVELFELDYLINRKNRLSESITHYLKKIDYVKNTNPYKLIEIIEDKDLLAFELGKIDEQKSYFREIIIKYEGILNNIKSGGYVGYSLN